MKLFLLFFASISFAQIENISVKFNTIYFTENIKNDSTYISRLSENPKISIAGKKGSFKNAKCNCKGSSIFMRDEFNFDFNIKDNIVEIFNIRFTNSIQMEMNGVRTTKKESPLELYALKNDNTIRDGGIFGKNFKCLNDYFQQIFIQ
jgi:hypothetical protein